jgi:choline monooxygenase
MRHQLDLFDPSVPIERALTPPASWYIDPDVLELERRTVLRRAWHPVAHLEQLRDPGDYVAGELVGEPFVVLRDGDELRGFFNVCRHHASHLVEGQGKVDRLTCPYHGWCYDLDGSLRSAPRLGGVREFDRSNYGLIPMDVAVWGPVVFARIDGDGPSLEISMAPVSSRVDCSSLRFVTRRSYEVGCNWKVFVDNYLDGGYHVGHLHHGLASQLDLDSYRTEIEGRVSLQTCSSGADGGKGVGVDFQERLGAGAVYAFVYPNFMINRYGPVMDTNWAVPLGPDRTLTVFDYFFDRDCDQQFIERSVEASDRVQQEDIAICEAVQRGLRSSAFDRGPYAPRVEQAAHHFHCLLKEDLAAGIDGGAEKS